MGWWSETIMGGDTPLDLKSEFYEMAGVDQFSPLTEKDKKALAGIQPGFTKGGMDDILNRWGCGKPDEDFYKDTKSIGFQVLAVILMKVGAPIKPKLKTLMLEWIPQDVWSNENPERKKHVDDLLEKVKAYTGKPTSVPEKGLFDAFSDKLSQG